MTWHMPPALRAGFIAIALLFAAARVLVTIDDLHPAQPAYIVLGVVMIPAAADLAATGWRAALIVAGDTLIVQSARRVKKIQRAEVTGINTSSSCLFKTTIDRIASCGSASRRRRDCWRPSC